jgi:hypothetical protein
MLIVDAHEARTWFGFGVAGNFAGHLEQAGEAGDFVSVTAPENAPKGIFPFYVPGKDSYLGTFPISSDTVQLPQSDTPLNLQIEPEAGLLCHVRYGADGSIERLTPYAIGAFNDCSIRRPDAQKLSEKKNWGPASKGLAARLLTVEDLGPAGGTADLRIASFLRRAGEAHAYGLDSPVVGYSYYGDVLLDWMVDRLHHQTGSPETPLENVGQYLLDACSPATVVIGIGATRYTEVGESTYLEDGDQAIVIVYDAMASTPEQVAAAVAAGTEDDLERASVLRQTVRTA